MNEIPDVINGLVSPIAPAAGAERRPAPLPAPSAQAPRFRADQPGRNRPALSPPRMDMAGRIAAIAELRARLINVSVQSAEASIRHGLEEKTGIHNERLADLKAAMAEQQRAKKAGLAGRILGWIATAATMLVGGILLASGVGAVAGGALLLSGSMLMTQQISAETGGWLTNGLGKMWETTGLSQADAQLAGQLSFCIAAAVLGIGGGLAGIRGGVTELSRRMAAMVTLGQVSGAAAGVGSGAAGITTAVGVHSAAVKGARSEEKAAMIEEVMFLLANDREFIQTLIDEVNEGAVLAHEILTAHESTLTRISHQIAH